MTADTIRLILLLTGIVLVAGIYLWDRYQRIAKRFPKIKEPARPRVDPRIDEVPATEPSMIALEDPGTIVDPPTLGPESEVIEDSDDLPSMSAVDVSSGENLDLDLDPHGNTDYLHHPPGVDEDLPRMVVQLNLHARGREFPGVAVAEAAEVVGMKLGAMAIYHRLDQRNPEMTLFSMASMVRPGTFPKKMATFETPGLTLFTQLPGYRDGLAIFSDMLFTAERLGVLLDADLRDDTHSALTKQTIEHLREQVLQHRLKVNLARKR